MTNGLWMALAAGIALPAAALGQTPAPGPKLVVQSAPSLQHADNGIRHTPSGALCLQKVAGTPANLAGVTPEPGVVTCEYTAGAAASLDVRYTLQVTNADVTPDQGVAETKQTLPAGAMERLSPWLGIGANPPVATFAANNGSGRTFAIWYGRKGDWLYAVSATYATSAELDAEAATVAQALLNANLKAQ